MSKNKFMVGAITAAMVASAVAPVAGAEQVKPNAETSFSDVGPDYTHFEAINKAVELKFLSGYTDGTFKPLRTLSRGDVVKSLGKYVVATSGKKLSEFDLKNVVPFNDVTSNHPDQELYTYSLVVKQAGIFDGSNNNLMPGSPIARQQIAKVLVNAFDLKDLEGDLSKVTDNDKAFDEFVPYINILSENGVTEVTEFMPLTKTVRGQFASFMVRAYEASGVVIPAPSEAPVLNYTGTSPINVAYGAAFTVPTVTATDDKDTNVAVTNVIRNASGATVSAIDTKVPGTYTITYSAVDSDGNKAKDLVVTVVVAQQVQTGVNVTTTTLDDDKAGQFITFNMDGVAADLDDLVNKQGYAVEFQADMNVFADGTTTSPTGAIDATKIDINDEFKVKVVLTKDGKVTQSTFATVHVVNLNATPQLDALALINLENGSRIVSDTLVIGESYDVAGLRSNTGDIVNVSGDAVYSSSNPAVALVNPETGVITPVAPGTVTITAKAGNQTSSVTVTVTNEEREFGSVTVSNDSLKLSRAADTSRTVQVQVKDQYGDLFSVQEASLDVNDNTDSLTVPATITPTATFGTGTLEITTAAEATAGNYAVYIREEANAPALQTINVQLTEGNVVDPSATQLQLASGSTAETTSITTDGAALLNVNEYTVDGGFVNTVTPLPGGAITTPDSSVTFGKYTVAVADAKVANLTVRSNGDVVVRGLKAGTTDITVTSADGTTRDTFTVTVSKVSTQVTNVTWTSTPTVIAALEDITVNDVLDIEQVDGDDIVNGLTLNVATTSFVRIDGEGTVYLDIDDSGDVSTGDVPLGFVRLQSSDLTVTPGSTTYTTAAGNEGTLVYSFLDMDRDVISATTVNVDVAEGTPQ